MKELRRSIDLHDINGVADHVGGALLPLGSLGVGFPNS
jgi:hypothetical protein